MRLVEEREDKRLRWQWQISFNRKETDMKSDITIIPSGNRTTSSEYMEPQVSWRFRNRQNLIQNSFAHQ